LLPLLPLLLLLLLLLLNLRCLHLPLPSPWFFYCGAVLLLWVWLMTLPSFLLSILLSTMEKSPAHCAALLAPGI